MKIIREWNMIQGQKVFFEVAEGESKIKVKFPEHELIINYAPIWSNDQLAMFMYGFKFGIESKKIV